MEPVVVVPAVGPDHHEREVAPPAGAGALAGVPGRHGLLRAAPVSTRTLPRTSRRAARRRRSGRRAVRARGRRATAPSGSRRGARGSSGSPPARRCAGAARAIWRGVRSVRVSNPSAAAHAVTSSQIGAPPRRATRVTARRPRPASARARARFIPRGGPARADGGRGPRGASSRSPARRAARRTSVDRVAELHVRFRDHAGVAWSPVEEREVAEEVARAKERDLSPVTLDPRPAGEDREELAPGRALGDEHLPVGALT